jgi:hypothetical protein
MSSMPWKEWTWPDNEPISSREETSSYWLWVVQLTLHINSQMLSLKDLNKFEETAEKSVTCAFLWAVLKLLTVRLQGTATASSIPQAYVTMLMFSQSLKQNVFLHMRSMIMSLTIMRRTLHTAPIQFVRQETSSSTKLSEWCLSEGLNSAFR